jgi:hypothetical protein
MRSHILQLLGCICEFEMLHAYLMLWGLKITDLCRLAGWLVGSTIQLNHAWMNAIAYFAVTWMDVPLQAVMGMRLMSLSQSLMSEIRLQSALFHGAQMPA